MLSSGLKNEFRQGPIVTLHLRASPKQQALLDVLLQLIKTWPLTIGLWYHICILRLIWYIERRMKWKHFLKTTDCLCNDTFKNFFIAQNYISKTSDSSRLAIPGWLIYSIFSTVSLKAKI